MMPDFLNDQARNWFGMKYETLTKYGIDAFWNDMNEPALFYSRYGIDWLNGKLKEFLANEKNEVPYFKLGMEVESLKNSMDDYRRFYHNTNQGWVRHDKVHNLYGCSMTRSASEAFETLRPGKRTLMFSRSSYIGMHRYGGIWTGDNKSWWSHLDLIVHQLPAINMAGFLYTGPDLGGFGEDTTRDLLMRFLQIGIFTPLMRNHSAIGTREQEPYQFERSEEIARLIRLRYRLIPYLYSEYLKAVENDTLLFKALAFEFKEDVIARSIEDQLLLGDQIMIAPVTRQNEPGRPVYLPEPMTRIVCSEDGIEQTALNAGWHYISYPLDSLVFFVRCSQAVPLGAAVLHIDDVNLETIEWLGDGTEYELYEDDGISANAPITRTVLTR
jgi:alpha-glucosidase